MQQLSLFDVVEENVPQVATATTWLLIDGNNMLNRAFYANQRELKAPDGRPTNAVSTFLSMLWNLKRYGTPVVFFDKGKGFRKALYPEYKEGRGATPELLVPQFPLMREILTAAGIPFLWDDLLEADDLIACACKSLNGHKYIVSNDKDLLQLVRDDVTVVSRKGGSDVEVTPGIFREMYDGLEPIQIVDLKAIAGDITDNIKGVEGVGDKGAMLFVQKYGNVENIAQQTEFPKEFSRYAKKMDAGREAMLFAKKLTTLRDDKLIQLNHYEVNESGLIAICEKLAMHSIIKLLR